MLGRSPLLLAPTPVPRTRRRVARVRAAAEPSSEQVTWRIDLLKEAVRSANIRIDAVQEEVRATGAARCEVGSEAPFQRLSGLDAVAAGVKELGERMDARFGDMQARMDNMEARIDKRLDGLEANVEVLTTTVVEIKKDSEVLKARFDLMDKRFDQTEKTLGVQLMAGFAVSTIIQVALAERGVAMMAQISQVVSKGGS